MPRVDLQQPQCRRAALGQIEGMASRCYSLRKDRLIFHGHSLPRRYLRLDQAMTRPSRLAARELGGDHRCDPSLHSLLECTSPSVCLGQTPPPLAASLPRHRPAAEGGMTYRMNYLGGAGYILWRWLF